MVVVSEVANQTISMEIFRPAIVVLAFQSQELRRYKKVLNFYGIATKKASVQV
jgi:hypothetical protein